MKRLTALLGAILLAGCLMGCSQSPEPQDAASAPSEESATPSEQNDSDSSESANAAPSPSDAKDEEPASEVPADAKISVEELHALLEGNPDIFILDIRTRKQYAEHFIPEAHNIPMGKQMEARLAEIPSNENIYIISSGDRGCAETYESLIGFGFDASRLFVVEGGMNEWLKAGYPVKKSPILSC